MKIDYTDVLAGAAVVAAMVGFYFVGRYHEDYLNEKQAKSADEQPATEPAEPMHSEKEA